MDFIKNRQWVCEFYPNQNFAQLPQTALVVEEVETYPYFIPNKSLRPKIPAGYGGQLTLVLQGKGILQVGDKCEEVGPNQAFLYNYKDEQISYFSPRKFSEKWRFLWIHLRGEAAENVIAEINRRWGYWFDLGENLALQQLLLTFKNLAGHCCYFSGSENFALTAKIFHLLVGQLEQQNIATTRAFPLNTIREKLKRAPRISDLAAEIGCSYSHLSRRYHAVTGETLQTLRRRQRLATAMEYLLKTSLSLKEISDKSGFNTYSSFFRAFVQEFHHAPRFFRSGKVE